MTMFSTQTARRWAAALAVALAVGAQPVQLAEAAGETRSLKLYFIHTGEKATITFKRNGKFDAKGLQEINRFLRDWRRNEPTRMDPRLFDLVWEVYNKVGASDYIHVVSAYRSPTTNAMLRSRTKGVAETSQHMRGKAMDFYIPGVPLKKLRETAVLYQRGGVGFYPTSRSPFVHLDVAGVRAWPRMPRDELVKLFPNGKTLHIPADGKPLPGYEQALAEYKARADAPIEIAETGKSKPKRPNLLAFLFGGGDEDEDADAIAAPSTPAPAPAAPAPQQAAPPVLTAEATPAQETLPAALNAPIPANRPALAPPQPAQPPQGTLMTALTPPPGANPALQAVQQEVQQPAFADLGNYRIPVPSLLSRDEPPPQELAFIPVPSRRPADAPAAVPTPAPAAIEPAAAPASTPLPAPALRPAVETQVATVAQAPVGGGFRPSTAVMMGGSEPLKAPATIREEATRLPAAPHAPAKPAAAQPVAVAEAAPVRIAKASRVTPPPAAPVAAPVKEEPRTVPVYGFDPKRF